MNSKYARHDVCSKSPVTTSQIKMFLNFDQEGYRNHVNEDENVITRILVDRDKPLNPFFGI